MQDKKQYLRLKRHRSIRLKIYATKERPRLVVRRSLNHLCAQIIDDANNKTLFSLSTLDKEIKEKFSSCGNIKAAEFFGQVFARRLKEKGITRIIFDRAGYMYHGRVKIFAESLRKAGLEF